MYFDDCIANHRQYLWSLMLAVAFFPGVVSGGPHDYQCITKSGYTLDDSGALTPHPAGSAFIGEQFGVDRETGRVVGGTFDNGSASAEVQVVDRGNANNAFKVFTKKYHHAELLIIAEHRAGTLKPFVGSSLREVLTGVCR